MKIPTVCDFCGENPAEVPINDEEGKEYWICFACDEQLEWKRV